MNKVDVVQDEKGESTVLDVHLWIDEADGKHVQQVRALRHFIQYKAAISFGPAVDGAAVLKA